MADKAGGAAAAQDADVAVASGPDSDAEERAARKLQTAVDYQERVLEGAIRGEEAADKAIERAEARLDSAEAAKARATERREAAEADLEAAKAAAGGEGSK